MQRERRVRKWRYNEDRVREVYELCLMGASDEDIARVMGVEVGTIDSWKRKYPEFLAAMRRGKDSADARIAASLYKRARGFWIVEDDIKMYRGEIIRTPVRKYYPPDSWAAHKWLTIRQRNRWADVSRSESMQTLVNINKFDLSSPTMEQLEFIRQIQEQQRKQALQSHVNSN